MVPFNGPAEIWKDFRSHPAPPASSAAPTHLHPRRSSGRRTRASPTSPPHHPRRRSTSFLSTAPTCLLHRRTRTLLSHPPTYNQAHILHPRRSSSPCSTPPSLHIPATDGIRPRALLGVLPPPATPASTPRPTHSTSPDPLFIPDLLHRPRGPTSYGPGTAIADPLSTSPRAPAIRSHRATTTVSGADPATQPHFSSTHRMQVSALSAVAPSSAALGDTVWTVGRAGVTESDSVALVDTVWLVQFLALGGEVTRLLLAETNYVLVGLGTVLEAEASLEKCVAEVVALVTGRGLLAPVPGGPTFVPVPWGSTTGEWIMTWALSAGARSVEEHLVVVLDVLWAAVVLLLGATAGVDIGTALLTAVLVLDLAAGAVGLSLSGRRASVWRTGHIGPRDSVFHWLPFRNACPLTALLPGTRSWTPWLGLSHHHIPGVPLSRRLAPPRGGHLRTLWPWLLRFFTEILATSVWRKGCTLCPSPTTPHLTQELPPDSSSPQALAMDTPSPLGTTTILTSDDGDFHYLLSSAPHPRIHECDIHLPPRSTDGSTPPPP